MRAAHVVATLAAGAVVVLAGCGGGDPAAGPAPLEQTALPELASRDRTLSRQLLAEDSFAPAALEALLETAGYRDGREREFSGHTPTFDHVIARSLSFEDAAGAQTYLDWVAGHTSELVGSTRPLAPLAIGADALLAELEPCPTCKKQLPTLVAAWRRGGAVGYLVAAGRDVDRSSIRSLVVAIDRTLAAAPS